MNRRKSDFIRKQILYPEYMFHKGCCETAEDWMRSIGVSPQCNFIMERLQGFMKEYKKLLLSKGFSLNGYPEGKFLELEIKDDEKLKEKILKVFGANIELFINGIDIDTLILQCAEDFTKCLFYYDCNPFEMETEEFMKCVYEI